MTKMYTLPVEVAPLLENPHVCRHWFLRLFINGSYQYFHAGSGRAKVELNGEVKEWVGVSDWQGRKLVYMDDITFPDFEYSTIYTITLADADNALYRDVLQYGHKYEGAPTNLYFAMFNQVTETLMSGLVDLFPGYLTSPETLSNVTDTQIQFNVVSVWEKMNFSMGGRWNYNSHVRKHPDDWFFRYTGQKFSEGWD